MPDLPLGRTWNYLLQVQEDVQAASWKSPHALPLRVPPGSEGRWHGKFFPGEQVWLLSPARSKHGIRFFSLVTKSSQSRGLLRPGPHAPSFLSRVLHPVTQEGGQRLLWALSLEGGSPSAFGGRVWPSSGAHPGQWARLTQTRSAEHSARKLVWSTKEKPEQHHCCYLLW